MLINKPFLVTLFLYCISISYLYSYNPRYRNSATEINQRKLAIQHIGNVDKTILKMLEPDIKKQYGFACVTAPATTAQELQKLYYTK
jgi:hypothetical protein